MEEETSSPKKRWINTKRGKGFIAGVLMPFACFISGQLWSPIEDNYRLYILGSLGTVVVIFIFVQVILKRFGFQGFDIMEKGSLGEDRAYVSFFAGVAFSILVVMVVTFIGSIFFGT